MSNLGSFADLANTKVGEVEKPKPLPIGHYSVMFTGLMKEHKAKSGNLAMRFPFKVIEPLSDVDMEAYALLTDGARQREHTIDFWMSPDARYRFTDFGKAMGHSDDMNLLELAEALATSNEPFMLEASHRPNEKDPDAPYIQWDSPAPLSTYAG